MAPTVPIDFSGQKQSMMGKSRKYSKGQLSGFVPDYRHAVETMGESEGFGSSGRVDTEMTASEDSCAPSKRKCISLNVDGYDSFGLPMQVLTLSRMSRSDRKDLEVRLNSELEQVRELQKKIETMSSVIMLSPSSDIPSCSDGKTRPPVEAYHRPAELTGPQSKKRAPPGRNGSRNKKSISAQLESVKPVATSNAQLMKQCDNLLNQLLKHNYGWVFKEPVDVVKLNIPDYFTVIKHPMDLGTAKNKMASGGYSNPLIFAADVRLTFSNAMTYNPPGNDVHIMAQTLSKYFEQRWKAIEKKLPVDVDHLAFRGSIHTEVIETATPMPPSKKKKTVPDSSFKPVKAVKAVKLETIKRIMTEEEKQKLSMEVDSLLGELPESIIDFLKEHSGEGQTSEEEIEIDFEVLSDDTLFALRKLVDEYLLEKEKGQAKAEPCEMEIVNEPGFSNSSLHPCNDMVDEDVDIVGGNDAPMSSFPPVEIEKDATHKNSKCSSSSSSSSGSGSSSSDSDSASSSESESRVPKASPVFGGGKEKLGSGAKSDQKRSDIGDSGIGNDPINRVGLVDQKSPSKPISVEESGCQEEENAPPERQVSPEKLYRAAVLRNRFADTIFKAKEKALEKGDKLDPEKLRIEREELERRRKEEKARLQAEARAAEEARKKVEAEAAAEVRRQRELEREAQRQALQMMEKTVEINENSRFMEDLEMFRAGDDDHLPHFIEETSPEHSQNELGSFKLQGSSNPLEQLGLFMKADDDIEIEEEEIDPPRNVTEPANNVEEGPSNQVDVVKEGPSNEAGSFKLQGSSNPLEQLGLFMKADDDIEIEEEEIDPPRNVTEPANNVEEGPSNQVDVVEEGRPSTEVHDFVEEGRPSNEVHVVEAGPLNEAHVVEEGPSNKADVEEGLSNEVDDFVEEGRPSNEVHDFVEEGRPSNEVHVVESGPLDEAHVVEEGPSSAADVEEGPSNEADVEEGPSNEADVEEGPANKAEGPSSAADVEEGPSNEAVVVEEGPSNKADVEEGPANKADVDVEEGPSNEVDVDEGPSNKVDVEGEPSNKVDAEEEPFNGVAVGEEAGNVMVEGSEKGGQGNDMGEGPFNGVAVEEEPGNEVGEVLEHEMGEGQGKENMGERHANEVKEVSANDIEEVQEGTSDHVEERAVDNVEEGTANAVADVEEGEID